MPRSGGDRRGSSRDRWRRKTWMLHAFGDGGVVPCTFCKRPLTRSKLEADRINPEGTYRRDNIQPACRRCNAARGNMSVEDFMYDARR